MNSDYPRLIALCGKPTSGKTTVAELLRDTLAYNIADDGLPLRHIAMQHLGLTHHQCFTQEGKLEAVALNGRQWTAREVLGEIGNAFEEKFGGDIIPMMTHRSLTKTGRYVMSSCRRDQCGYWRNQGALVLEILNDDVPESPYEFDRYDPGYAHAQIANHGPFRSEDMLDNINKLMDDIRVVLKDWAETHRKVAAE